MLGRTRSVRQALKRVCLAIAHRGVKHNVSRHQVPNRPDRPDADRDEVVFENNAVVLAWTPSHLFVGSSPAWSQAAQAAGEVLEDAGISPDRWRVRAADLAAADCMIRSRRCRSLTNWSLVADGRCRSSLGGARGGHGPCSPRGSTSAYGHVPGEVSKTVDMGDNHSTPLTHLNPDGTVDARLNESDSFRATARRSAPKRLAR